MGLLSPLAWVNPPQIMYFPEEPGCFSEDAGAEAGAITFDLKEGGHQYLVGQIQGTSPWAPEAAGRHLLGGLV